MCSRVHNLIVMIGTVMAPFAKAGIEPRLLILSSDDLEHSTNGTVKKIMIMILLSNYILTYVFFFGGAAG